MDEITEYTFDIMTTDGSVMRKKFTGSINTSSFISNYIKDMGMEDNHIELIHCGDRNMSSQDIELFYNIWQYLAGTVDGIIFAGKIGPDYFDEKGCELSQFLPVELLTLLTPSDEEIIQHKKFLAQKSTVTFDNMDTNEITVQLLKFQPFLTLTKLIMYANFLAIEPMLHLLAKLFAEYIKLSTTIRVRKTNPATPTHDIDTESSTQYDATEASV